MTSIINGFTQQKSTKTAYDTGQPCDCFTCTAFTVNRECGKTDGMDDWEFGHEACCFTCPNKRQCAKPDPGDCTIGFDSHKRDPLTRVTWNGNGPNLKCIFDVNKINTLEQIDLFKQRFGTGNDYNAVLANYCQQSSDTCIIDPETGQNMPKCSRLKSTGKDGELCRSWFNRQGAADQNTVVQNYCAINNTPDCKCVNRAINEVYRSLKVGKDINDGCWFTPCANPQSYLQTSDIVNPTCPSNYCETIYNIIKDRDVTIDNVKNEINCKFAPEPPKPTPVPPTPTPPKPIPVPPPKPTPVPPPKPTPVPPPKPTPLPPPKPTPVPPPKPTPLPPTPLPPKPIPGPPIPEIPKFDLKKNYLVVAFLVTIVIIPIFKSSRDLIFSNVFLGFLFYILLGINTYSLQKWLNDKF